MVHIGININNREPLITEEYSVSDMFSMAAEAEELGYDSVWVGDSLLEKPRYDAISCLGRLTERTDEVKLGTACMVTPLRNPIQFAQAWSTLDTFSDGRMILGACMGSASDLGKKQYEVLGIPSRRRPQILREGTEVMKQLWEEGEVTYSGDYFEYENVSFSTGQERRPLEPVQESPPVWVISNPSARGNDEVHSHAVKRIVDTGDGWMTCCRAQHPEEYTAQIEAISAYAEEQGKDMADIATSYQVTTHIADTKAEAEANMNEYVDRYYPDQFYNLEDWGPIGSAAEIAEWIKDFESRGCETFIMRFGAFDQISQMRRFADEVLPRL